MNYVKNNGHDQLKMAADNDKPQLKALGNGFATGDYSLGPVTNSELMMRLKEEKQGMNGALQKRRSRRSEMVDNYGIQSRLRPRKSRL